MSWQACNLRKCHPIPISEFVTQLYIYGMFTTVYQYSQVLDVFVFHIIAIVYLILSSFVWAGEGI